MALQSRHRNAANVRPLEADPVILAVCLLGLGDATPAEAAAMAGMAPDEFALVLEDEAVVSRAEREALRLQSSDDLAVLRARKTLNEVLATLRIRARDEASTLSAHELVKIAQLSETLSGLIQRRGAELRVDIDAALTTPFLNQMTITRGDGLSVTLIAGEGGL